MLQEKKNNAPSNRSTKLPSIYKLPSQHLLTKLELDHFITDSPSIQFNLSQLELIPPSYKRYETKENQINRIRQIAKSNYIKNVTQQASEELSRSRMESIQGLKKKVMQHQKHQKIIEVEIKKQQNARRELEKQRVKERKKKIDQLDKLQRLKKQKLSIKDRIYQLQNTLKLYQSYEKFCQQVIGDELEKSDIHDLNFDQIHKSIMYLEQNCLKECQLNKILNDELMSTKNKLSERKSHYDPIKQSYQLRMNNLIVSISDIQTEIDNHKNHLRIIHYDRNKRGPFSIIYSMASKFLKNKNQIDLEEQNGFMDTLSKMEDNIEKLLEEIQKNRKLDSIRYNKKQYEYLLGKLHPSRMGGNEDEKYRRF